MNIDSLKLFYYVAQANSISVVAKQNHISQSALSQQLFKLEEKLDVKLFNRSNKGVSLTREGEIVLKHCKNIFKSAELLLQELDSLKRNKELVTIKAPEILNSTLISSSLMNIRNRYSKLTINLFNLHHYNELIHSYLEDEIGFSYIEKGNSPGIIREKIYDDELIIISNSTQTIEELTTRDLFSIPLILVEDLISAHKHLTEELEKITPSSKKLNVVLTTQSYGPAIFALSSSNTFLLVPKSAFLVYYKNIGFKHIPFKEFSLPLSLYITYSETFFKTEKRFITALKKSILDNLT